MRETIPRGPTYVTEAIAGTILILALGVFSACDTRDANEYASPESAAYAMFTAFSYIGGNPDSAWAFLGPDTRARLEALAEQGPEGLKPTDYLRFGWLPDEALVRSVERVDNGGRYAHLVIETELGDRFDLELMRVNRGWQIELGSVAILDAVAPEHDGLGADEPGADEEGP